MYNYHVLSNGIRLIHKYVDSPVTHCGIMIHAGSRDEAETENGIAHFIEHCIFKGTRKRKAYHVLTRLEHVGGDLNAYTTKEETCIYASFLNTYFETALELFSDIVFNSTFPEKEIQKEKDVIIDEYYSYEDSPAELIFDEFDELIFGSHPLGRKILGDIKLIKKFKSADIQKFIANNYHTDQMVICSVGKIDIKKVIYWTEKYFASQPASYLLKQRQSPDLYVPTQKIQKRKNHQIHCMIGNRAYNSVDERKEAMTLLANLLGGPAMSSRLNLAIREKYGFTYNLEANYTPYSDTGLWSIYLGTDEKHFPKTVELVHKELRKLCDSALGNIQLHTAKKQIIGQLAISFESNLNEMLSIGKSYLAFNKVDSIENMVQKIEKITASELLAIANEVFDPKQLSTLIYQR